MFWVVEQCLWVVVKALITGFYVVTAFLSGCSGISNWLLGSSRCLLGVLGVFYSVAKWL